MNNIYKKTLIAQGFRNKPTNKFQNKSKIEFVEQLLKSSFFEKLTKKRF